MDKDTKKMLLLLALIWLFRTQYKVTADIEYPFIPGEGL